MSAALPFLQPPSRSGVSCCLLSRRTGRPWLLARTRYARIPEVLPIPNLIELQLDSFKWFIEKGLRELFDEISPIKDFTAKVMELQFLDYEFGEPKYSEEECRTKDLTYLAAAVRQRRAPDQGDRRDPAPARLHGRLPVDDRPGHVRDQRRRARRRQPARPLAGRLLQRARGPGVGPDALQPRPRSSRTAAPGSSSRRTTRTSSGSRSTASARSPRRPCSAPSATRRTTRSPRSSRASTADPDHPFIANTLDKDLTKTQQEALIEVYKKLRPGDPPTGDNARQLVESLFFNFRRYDLGRVGRYKFNKKLDGVAGRMGIELPARAADDHPRGHRRDRRPPHRVEPRPPSQGRHRPPRQPPHPGQRRADPERVPDRPPPHGARRPRADDDPGDRQGDPERAHQHPAGRGRDEGVLRRQPAVSQFMDQTNPLAELTSKRRL